MRSFLGLYGSLLDVLPGKARRFVIGYAVALALLAILDALSLALIAAVVSPLVSSSSVSLPVFGEVSGFGLIGLIGLVCILVLIKGFLSVLLLWLATRRFAAFELEIGTRLFDSYLEAPWVERLRRNSADLIRLVDSGVTLSVNSVLLPGVGLFGEFITFVTIVAVLAIAQPVVAVVAIVYLGLIGLAMFFWITKRSRRNGLINLEYSLKVSRLMTEMAGALKEITLRNKSREVAGIVRANRVRTSRARSNIQFFAQVPRFILETAIVGGFVVVGVAGYLLGGMPVALTSIALFALAGFRMAPSLVRFQNVVSQINANTPHARRIIADIHEAEAAAARRVRGDEAELPDHPRELAMRSVTFSYAPGSAPAVSGVDLVIPFGTTAAFVGSSGAGKSTVIDLLLGLIDPTEGVIDVDGVPLSSLTTAWRGRVGYVPQDVALFDSSVAQNVALAWKDDEVDRERVREALRRAQLLDVIEGRPDGIDAQIGERGLSLSGGQRQRLGIARALYADPLVLVMDEATSALDTATEAAVTDAIKQLRGSITIITVAHRLSTVMHSDTIFFMRDGKVAAQGTFDELIAGEPEFAHQAGLAGLGGGTGG